MLVHIYIYEYIFPLHPLWLDLKIEKNYHYGGGEYYVIHEENFCWLLEREKKASAHFNSNTLSYCFCNQKTRFFFCTPHLPFFCIYNTYRTRLLNCEDRAGSSLWCKRSWNATLRRGSWVWWRIKRKWEGGKDSKKKAQTFDVAATNLPCDRRYMGAINELYQPLHMQSDDSGQGVNWILTGTSDTPGPRWWGGKAYPSDEL